MVLSAAGPAMGPAACARGAVSGGRGNGRLCGCAPGGPDVCLPACRSRPFARGAGSGRRTVSRRGVRPSARTALRLGGRLRARASGRGGASGFRGTVRGRAASASGAASRPCRRSPPFPRRPNPAGSPAGRRQTPPAGRGTPPARTPPPPSPHPAGRSRRGGRRRPGAPQDWLPALLSRRRARGIPRCPSSSKCRANSRRQTPPPAFQSKAPPGPSFRNLPG